MRVLSLKNFFLPLGCRYQNFLRPFFAAVTAESIGSLKPVISLNTMQNTARVEKADFLKKFPFSIFGQFPISPTQDVKVHFNSPREDLKKAYRRSLPSPSVLPKFALLAFWGVDRPPVATPLMTSNLMPIERTPLAPQVSRKSRKTIKRIFHKSTFSI